MLDEITVAISGASGAVYSLRLLEQLVLADRQIALVISTAGFLVLNDETDLILSGNPERLMSTLTDYFSAQPGQITVYSKDQWYSPLASGTGAPKKMVVCPCSMGCLAAIAIGASDNLLERAADVVIKEQGKLILVPREMPFSVIHLEHMLKLARLGVCIMPANPGFYFRPTTVDELVDFVVARILDQLNVVHQLSERWGRT